MKVHPLTPLFERRFAPIHREGAVSPKAVRVLIQAIGDLPSPVGLLDEDGPHLLTDDKAVAGKIPDGGVLG
jgi:hypothetical protein